MTVNLKKEADKTVVEIVGRLDTMTAPILEKALKEEVGEAFNIVLDMNNLDYISSAGLRVLLGAQKKFQKLGSMKLIGVHDEVMEVFDITGFTDILTIE